VLAYKCQAHVHGAWVVVIAVRVTLAIAADVQIFVTVLAGAPVAAADAHSAAAGIAGCAEQAVIARQGIEGVFAITGEAGVGGAGILVIAIGGAEALHAAVGGLVAEGLGGIEGRAIQGLIDTIARGRVAYFHARAEEPIGAVGIGKALDAGVFGFIAVRRLRTDNGAVDRPGARAGAGEHVASFPAIAENGIVAVPIGKAINAALPGFIACPAGAGVPIAHALAAGARVALGAETPVIAWVSVVLEQARAQAASVCGAGILVITLGVIQAFAAEIVLLITKQRAAG
jgi:hypothetical protein